MSSVWPEGFFPILEAFVAFCPSAQNSVGTFRPLHSLKAGGERGAVQDPGFTGRRLM